jgi:hypothetical protein
MRIFMMMLLLVTQLTWAQEKGKPKEKVVYKYKKYEKFDFDELSVTGEAGSPGDLSVTPRYQKRFDNKLPLKTDFNPEIRKSIERVQ